MAFLADLRVAIRALSMNRGFTLVVVLTLGVSIGATTAVFSVVEGVLVRPLPFDQPDRLVRPTWDRTVRNGWPFNAMGLTLLTERSRSYTSFGIHSAQPASVTVMAAGEPQQIQLLPVDAGFWSTLGVSPVMGRLFTPEEDVPGGPILALISEPFWVEQYGADPSAIGSTLEMNGFPVVTREFGESGELEGETTLRDARRETFESGTFEPPSGYKRQQIMGGGL